MSGASKEKKLVSISPSKSLPGVTNDARVNDKPKRQSFDAKPKRKILEKLEECKKVRGAVGELLRKEGLYAAQVAKCCQQRKSANF